MSEKVIYTGHFVEDQDALLAQIPSQIEEEGVKIHGHHVTREFKPANGTEDITPGNRRTLRAIGEVVADGVHAVLVESVDGQPFSTNEHPHLTIATAPGVSPTKSNEVIAAAHKDGTIRPIEPPVEFETVEGYFNGKKDVTSQVQATGHIQ